MASLTANRPTDRQGGTDSGVVVNRVAIPVADNVHIYQGGLVQVNGSGYATPAGTATQADSHTFITAGRAYEEYDNTVVGHTLGALTAQIDQGAFGWDILGSDTVAQANVLQNVYAEDDHTVRAGSNGSTRAVAGKLLAVLTLPEFGTQAIVQTVSV